MPTYTALTYLLVRDPVAFPTLGGLAVDLVIGNSIPGIATFYRPGDAVDPAKLPAADLYDLVGRGKVSVTGAGGDVGTQWTARGYMGQLILADPVHVIQAGVDRTSLNEGNGTAFSYDNINGWTDYGPNNPSFGGLAGWQSHMLNVTIANEIAATLALGGQGIIIWDICGVGHSTFAHSDYQYLGDPRFMNPWSAAAGLTVNSGFNPYIPPGSGSSMLANGSICPEMASDFNGKGPLADQIFAAISKTGLIPGICIRAQRVSIDANGEINGINQYDTTANQLADLDAKVTYAYSRWGVRIFYVDSNQNAVDAPITPSYAPAYVYTQLFQRHPDCVFFPEEAFEQAMSIPSLGINDPAYQYQRVASRYTAIEGNDQGSAVFNSPLWPTVGPNIESGMLFNELTAVPSTFSMVAVNNVALSSGGQVIGTNPATCYEVPTCKIVAGLIANQLILLGDTNMAKWFYQQAGTNGFAPAGPRPTITGLSPAGGPITGGTTVIITGANFSGAGITVQKVFFQFTASATFTVNSATQITATTPDMTPDLGSPSCLIHVMVQTNNGTTTAALADQFGCIPAPTVTSVSPASGAAGATVTVSGANYSGKDRATGNPTLTWNAVSQVLFGAVAATNVQVTGSGTLTCTAPAHSAGAVDVRVVTPAGTSAINAPNDQFTY